MVNSFPIIPWKNLPLTELAHFVATAKNNNFPLCDKLWHLGTRGLLHMVSEQKVETLGPDGLIDIQVCCELCDLTM